MPYKELVTPRVGIGYTEGSDKTVIESDRNIRAIN